MELLILGIAGVAVLGAWTLHRLRLQRAAKALQDRRAQNAIAVVPLLERLRVDPAAWREQDRPRWPPHDAFDMQQDESVWMVRRTRRRQWTQHREGVLVITDQRLFFDPEIIRTNWSRTWPSIARSEAGPDHVRVHTSSGDTMVFELDDDDPNSHPALVLAMLDHAAARSADRIASLPVSGSGAPEAG